MEHEPIPGPAGWPLIGNLRDIDLNNTVQSFMALADEFGPIYKLRLGGTDRLFLSNHVFVDEVCTRKEYGKHIMGAVGALAQVLPDGLFSAQTAQKTWGQARRTLNPVFTPGTIRSMFPEMLDVTSQLVLKWARHGPKTPIDVSADMTRLTLDTIALTAMDTRFNSFYHDEVHPFVRSFGDMFSEMQRRSNRPAWYTALQWTANRKFEENNTFIRDFCADVLAYRRERESEEENGEQLLSNRKDVFTAMLHRRDPVTDEQLDDSVIIDNMITFLFAGHDTTSGLLSFLLFHLVRNRNAYKKLQDEIDSVIGTGALTVDHLDKLSYLKACLYETLRLDPPAQAFAVTPQVQRDDKEEGKDVKMDLESVLLLGGRYSISYGQSAIVIIPSLHRDKSVFGEDANAFRPERMTKEKMDKLPRNSFKPFGNGVRTCIGSNFALQEAMVTAAVLFQKFDFDLVDPDYQLQYQPSLNRKPNGLFVYARLRPKVDILSLHRDLFVPAVDKHSKEQDA
ncbi:cytochrome P450 [Rhypophila decipiens]|uniref:Cytochrome P450 n=1 Tax=Rhypophila decipiens TaxID=261697 RepID=A0AAN6Y043_9PEZI|nr:cytochrome P450 [Rhypophila decipiens]